MSASLPRPLLTVYQRERCHLCDELRGILQSVLEERAARSQVVPALREVDVDADPQLAARYGALVPVLALGEHELPLAMSARHVRAFLDALLPQLA